jgi:hypothetical protein
MVPGLGRGTPATPPGRGAAGRSVLGEPNGLFPGRGAGLAMPVLPNGLFPGRDPAGFGVGAESVDSGSTFAAGFAAGLAAASVAGSVATGSVGAADTGSVTDSVAGVGGAAFLAAFLATFFAGFSSPGGIGGNASFSRRATGASTVDDAERTNSPMS